MARSKRNTVRAVAAAGSGALVVWLLWRGWPGWGGSDRSDHSGDGHAGASDNSESDGAIEEVTVWLRHDDSVELDGAESDLAKTLARARDVGRAKVHATGAVRTGWIGAVINALQDAGVEVWATPEMWRAASEERASRKPLTGDPVAHRL